MFDYCAGCYQKVPSDRTVSYQDRIYCADCWLKKLKAISRNHPSEGPPPGPLHIDEPPDTKGSSGAA